MVVVAGRSGDIVDRPDGLQPSTETSGREMSSSSNHPSSSSAHHQAHHPPPSSSPSSTSSVSLPPGRPPTRSSLKPSRLTKKGSSRGNSLFGSFLNKKRSFNRLTTLSLSSSSISLRLLRSGRAHDYSPSSNTATELEDGDDEGEGDDDGEEDEEDDDEEESTSNQFGSRLEEWWSDQFNHRPSEGQRVEKSYSDRTMIDWAYEDRKEHARLQELDRLTGLKGLISRLIDVTWPWIGVILIGIIVGLLAGCLGTLALWLSDVRDGKCDYAFYLNKNACCSGVEPDEVCYEWSTWPHVFNISYIPLASFIHYLVYILTSVVFAGVAALLVKAFAPFAFHTGIPEIKVILSGYVFQHYLSAWTLAIKAIGLAFAVGSGLSLGKEGPLVHVSCCVANFVLQKFNVFRTNEARKREMLSAAAASGVSVAFGAPLGGVLFVLEELSLASLPQPTLWRSFVCAVVATMTLQSFDPFDSGKLVLFQVQSVGQVWRAFELIPWVFLGVCGGLFGACFIRANIEYAKIRRSVGLADHPIKEVLAVAGFTAFLSYLLVITRYPTSQLVEALFKECSATSFDVFSLCDPTRIVTTVILLLISAMAKAVVTSITFGIQVPSGIFLPAISIGACFGRAIGMIMNAWQQNYPRFWLFGNCPPEGTCISPQVYAVIGAASAVGGLTRMTVSLVVIIFELTGAVELVLQIMMAVMISKFTADYFSTDGIYEAWIHFRGYPYLSPKDEYQSLEGVIASQVMVKDLVSLSAQGWTLDTLDETVQRYEFSGFPIVSSPFQNQNRSILLGYIPSNELRFALAQARSRPEYDGSTRCEFFSNTKPNASMANMTSPGKNKLGQLRIQDGNDDRPNVSSEKIPERRSLDRKIAQDFNPSLSPTYARFPPTPDKAHHDTTMDCSSPSQSNHPDDRLSQTSHDTSQFIDLNRWVDEAPLTLEPETPIEIVLQYFQRLGLRNMLFTSRGRLAGILTIKDLHHYLRAPYYYSSKKTRT